MRVGGISRITAERATYSEPWMRRNDVFRAMDEEEKDQCELVTTAGHQTPGPSLATVRKRRQRARVAAFEETAEAA